MLWYILKRVLLFIPTLFAISLLAFIISINAPGDPVDRLLNAGDDEGAMGQNISHLEKLKQQKRYELGLDLPVFYLSLGTLADIDTLHKIPDAEEQEMIQRMIYQTGNKEKVIAYYAALKNALYAVEKLGVETSKNNGETAEAADSAHDIERYLFISLTTAFLEILNFEF